MIHFGYAYILLCSAKLKEEFFLSEKMKQIKVYFPVEDFDRLKESSKSQNITMSEFIRNSTNSKLENAPAPKTKKVYKVSDPKLLFFLSNISNNINQIAKKINSKNEFDRKAIFDIYEKVMSFK